MPGGRKRAPWALYGLAGVVAASIVLLLLLAPNRRANAEPAGGGLALTAPLPDRVGKDTVLTVGDPVTQWVFEHNGWDKQLPFTIRWAQITGGPDVTEAFNAKALDVGVGANAPPIHAIWVGLPVKIITVRERYDPIAHPAFVLGVAPKSGIRKLADLKGKRIAFSPSQIQGQIVIETLKAVGLTQKDVTLVELPSSIGGDVYSSALASNVVDAAPIGSGIVAERYVRSFGRDGARLLNHPPFRDDIIVSFVRVETLEDPAKAAALKLYVKWWAKAQAWQQEHKDELARGYYQRRLGVSAADARLIVRASGDIVLPRDWDEARRHQQQAIDLMSPAVQHPRFAAATMFDPRFETLATTPRQHEGDPK